VFGSSFGGDAEWKEEVERGDSGKCIILRRCRMGDLDAGDLMGDRLSYPFWSPITRNILSFHHGEKENRSTHLRIRYVGLKII